jgi:hypothetical protein
VKRRAVYLDDQASGPPAQIRLLTRYPRVQQRKWAVCVPQRLERSDLGAAPRALQWQAGITRDRVRKAA